MRTFRMSKNSIWALCIALGLTGCTVNAWERGTLAKPQMAVDLHPMQSALRAHNYGSREAASGTSSASGGGCGCY
jgi:hypothetical protein